MRKIVVVDYDPIWRQRYKEEEKKIASILKTELRSIHHIGSTAVEGLSAKPVIDILAVVHRIEAVDRYCADLEAIGYECKGEYGIAGRRFFMKGGDDRTHHLHIFSVENDREFLRHLALRDYLRNFPQKAKKYADLKRALAQKFNEDAEGYCAGKDAFVKALESEALDWAQRMQGVAERDPK